MSLRPALVAAAFWRLSCAAAAQAPNNPVLPGGKSGQPIDIDAGKLDYFDKEQKLIYTGNVVAVQGGSRLKASTLTIYLFPKDEANAGGPLEHTEVRRMEAAGPVTLTSKDQVGTGDRGVYEKGDNKVTLLGNVTLTQGPNVTKGDLVYDLTTKQAVVGTTCEHVPPEQTRARAGRSTRRPSGGQAERRRRQIYLTGCSGARSTPDRRRRR